MQPFSRRRVLKALGAGLAGFASASQPLFGQDASGGFKIAIQSFSLRAFGLDETIAHIRRLGVQYAEFYPGRQMPLSSDSAKIAAYKNKLTSAGITMASYGVVSFSSDRDRNQRIFDFAKALELKTIVADPHPESFDHLAALTRQADIKVAIHNHGPRHRYSTIGDIERALEKAPEAIGVCVDTGLFYRSGEDPGTAIRRFGSRVYGVHLKDVKSKMQWAILGRGKIDLVDVFRALKEVKFDRVVAIEYEENENDPVEDVQQCVGFVRGVINRL